MNNTCHRCLSTFEPVGKDACAFCFGRTVYHRQFDRTHSTVMFEAPVAERAAKVQDFRDGKRKKR